MSNDDLEVMRDALRRGLGRAYTMIESGPAEKYADLLLDACLHDPDPGLKSEGSHSWWIAQLVQLAGLEDAVLQALLPRIRRAGADNWSNNRRFAIARHLGGDERPVREAMMVGLRHAVDRQLRAAHPGDLEDLVWEVAMLGDRRIVWAFIQAGRLVDEQSHRPSSHVLDNVNEEFGEAYVQEILALDKDHPDLQRYLQAVEAGRQRADDPPFDPSWELVRDRIEAHASATTPGSPASRKWRVGSGDPRHWGRRTTDGEFARAAKFLASLDRSRTTALADTLRIFERRAFPGDPGLLLAFARDPRLMVAEAALGALVLLQDPRIRTLALEVATARSPRIRRFVPDLLVRNWEPGDERFVGSLIARASTDRERELLIHGLLDLAAAQPVTALVPSLLLAYELGPCAYCRRGVVEALIERNALPDAIRDECRHDVFDETVALVEALPAES